MRGGGPVTRHPGVLPVLVSVSLPFCLLILACTILFAFAWLCHRPAGARLRMPAWARVAWYRLTGRMPRCKDGRYPDKRLSDAEAIAFCQIVQFDRERGAYGAEPDHKVGRNRDR